MVYYIAIHELTNTDTSCDFAYCFKVRGIFHKTWLCKQDAELFWQNNIRYMSNWPVDIPNELKMEWTGWHPIASIGLRLKEGVIPSNGVCVYDYSDILQMLQKKD